MPLRPCDFFRQLFAGLLKKKNKASRPASRRSLRPVVEDLEERLTPTAGVQEQYMLDLINRFRANPVAELSLILNSGNTAVNNGLSSYNVDRNALATQFASLTAVPPLAWNDSLGSSALGHSQAMLATSDPNPGHQVTGEADPWTRMVAAGYTNYSFLAENIYAFATAVFDAEAAFVIDWGANPPTGIQSPAGHRQNLLDSDLREVGIGLVNAPSGSPKGPLLVTQDFGNRFNLGNPFLLGNVYTDTSNDGYYEPGEGLGSVTLNITGSGGTFQTTTTAAGGYQIQLPAGSYQIVASGGGLSGPLTQNVTVGAVNVQADLIQGLTAAPSFTGPASSTTSNKPVISWTAVTGATQYDLWVDNTTTHQAQVIRQTALSTNTYTPTTGLPADDYQAFIRVTTAAGTSGWSSAYKFTITPPAVPTLTAPTGASSNMTPTFTWSASTDATHYDLWVNNTTTNQIQIIRQQNITTTSYTSVSALPLGSYVAWVQAFDSTGNSAGWSSTLGFTITGPAAPTLTAPTGTSTNALPTFTWTSTTGATRYDLWVANLTTGQGQIIRQQNVATTSYTAAAALPAGSYDAWVEAYNGAIALGGWSTGLTFSIAAPAAPALTGPAAIITTTTPTFTWNASTDATQYDVWANNTTTGQAQIVRQTVTTTSFTPAAALPRGQYVFWVRAGNAGSFGSWGSGASFLIDTTAPTIPTINGPTTPTALLRPTITWSASSGATHYDLWVNNQTTGQAQVIRQPNLATNSYTPAANLPVGNYVAWVEAFDNTNQTRGWSPTYSFSISLPAQPTQLSPSGTISNTTPTFSWAAVTGAATYDLWVDDKTTGQNQLIRQQALALNSFTPASALARGNYRFWVRALNANGNSSTWSAEVDFTIS